MAATPPPPRESKLVLWSTVFYFYCGTLQFALTNLWVWQTIDVARARPTPAGVQILVLLSTVFFSFVLWELQAPKVVYMVVSYKNSTFSRVCFHD